MRDSYVVIWENDPVERVMGYEFHVFYFRKSQDQVRHTVPFSHAGGVQGDIEDKPAWALEGSRVSTRDAVLPIVSVLLLSIQQKKPLSALLRELPPRYIPLYGGFLIDNIS